jgi:hypothetical protein
MFPVAPLPDAVLAPRDLAETTVRTNSKFARKSALDLASPKGKIRVAFGQRPNRVYMVGQYADGRCFEWVPPLNDRIDAPQPVDLPHQEVTRSVGERDGEEEGPTFDVCTTISRHGNDSIIDLVTWDFRRVGKGAQRLFDLARAFARLSPPYLNAGSKISTRVELS